MTALKTGSRAHVEWAFGSAVMVVALLSLSSIGLYVAPVAIILCWVIARRDRAWPEALIGGGLGAGAVFLVLAYLNRGVVPCVVNPGRFGPGERAVCGGSSPMVWLALGAAMCGVSLAAVTAFRRSGGNSPSGTSSQ